MLIGILLMVWYLVGLFVNAFVRPFGHPIEVILLPPFWPAICWSEWRDARRLEKAYLERYKQDEILLCLLMGAIFVKAATELCIPHQDKVTKG